MTETNRIFGSCVLFKELFEDDLGHLFRAGAITGNTIDRKVWMRILDAPGLPAKKIIAAFSDARVIGETATGAQLPSRPLFLESDGVPALGCDFVPGQPLNRVLARARDEAFPLQPDNTLLIVEKIALALTAGAAVEIDGKPLTHGFLHPGLIYLSNDGEALVTAFGLGEVLLGSIRESEVAAGCRAYLAPEILAGGLPSPEGDVYSLGAILFHLLTGTALPADPDERDAALEAAHTAWEGERLASDIQAILVRALASAPEARFATAAEFRSELDRLIYGGAYSPTTFNLALFMDRLFRSEIEGDEEDLQKESEFELPPVILPDAEDEEPARVTADSVAEIEALPPDKEGSGKRILWVAIGAVAIIGVAALIFWAGREIGPQQQLTPTPTAEEIAAQRQAQEDRLRTLTQEMVKEMMVEREEEIRQELIARQTRIEELQKRLQQSELRAKTSAVAAAKEAETQKELMKEIEEQEEAQRAQEEALETERRKALDTAGNEAAVAAGAGAALDANAETPSGDAKKIMPEERAAPSPTPPPPPTRTPEPTKARVVTAVKVGQFFPPAEVDTLPVVIKSQPLEWPRSAARSKGKGVVVVQLTVNASGGVDGVEVLRADHTGWGIPETATEAASGYRFKPGTKNGVAITTHAFVTWRYDFTGE